MEFDQLMIDILVYVSCKFEMYSFKIAQVISENVHIVFLYVLSIYVTAHIRMLRQNGHGHGVQRKMISVDNFFVFLS